MYIYTRRMTRQLVMDEQHKLQVAFGLMNNCCHAYKFLKIVMEHQLNYC